MWETFGQRAAECHRVQEVCLPRVRPSDRPPSSGTRSVTNLVQGTRQSLAIRYSDPLPPGSAVVRASETQINFALNRLHPREFGAHHPERIVSRAVIYNNDFKGYIA